MYREQIIAFFFGRSDHLLMTLIPIPRAEAGGLIIQLGEVLNADSSFRYSFGSIYVSGTKSNPFKLAVINISRAETLFKQDMVHIHLIFSSYFKRRWKMRNLLPNRNLITGFIPHL